LMVCGDYLFSTVLGSPFFHYLGVISYSTYLSHYLIKDWVKFVSDTLGLLQFAMYILICLVASHILYKLIEEPSRRILKNKLLGRSR
jgi:peptidoglycan/LPS O-acetylase OafA/YrhL